MKVSALEHILKENEERIKDLKPRIAHYYLYLNIKKFMLEFSSTDTYLIDPDAKTIKIMKVINHNHVHVYTIDIKSIKTVELAMRFED